MGQIEFRASRCKVPARDREVSYMADLIAHGRLAIERYESTGRPELAAIKRRSLAVTERDARRGRVMPGEELIVARLEAKRRELAERDDRFGARQQGVRDCGNCGRRNVKIGDVCGSCGLTVFLPVPSATSGGRGGS